MVGSQADRVRTTMASAAMGRATEILPSPIAEGVLAPRIETEHNRVKSFVFMRSSNQLVL